jgi:hypothetical protein
MPMVFIGKFEGGEALSKTTSPSPFKERGIKGVRLINNLNIWHLATK